MQAPALTSSPVSLLTYRESARKAVLNLLQSVHGPKAIVVEKSLSGPLGLIIEPAKLREHGVEEVSYLKAEPLELRNTEVIFLCHPDVRAVCLIADQVQHFKGSGQTKSVRIAFAPRSTTACERALEENGIFDDVTIVDLPVDLVPYDDDVMSLEMPNSFKESIIDGDTGSVATVARSLFNLQVMCGVIPKVYAGVYLLRVNYSDYELLSPGKGRLSKLAFDLSSRLIREADTSSFPSSTEISSLILIDREIDLLTPMCTPLTYEGLVDEFLGIASNVVDVPVDLCPEDRKKHSEADKPVKVHMNSNDQVFGGIRDVNFAALGQTLKQRALLIKEFEEARQNLTNIGEIKSYVRKLKDMNVPQEKSNMALHTNIAEFLAKKVKDYFFSRRLAAEQHALEGSFDVPSEFAEDSLFRLEDPYDALRLMCLLSMTGNGLKKFDERRRDILHAFGFDFLPGLYNLEKAGMLRKHDGKGNWSSVRKAFKLLVDVNESNPNDIGYVFSGYAPLTVRLVEHAVRNGWKSIEEPLKQVVGPAFEERQAVSSADMKGGDMGSRSVVAVFFVGGVTFPEINALRWLGKQLNTDFLVLTTSIMNGKMLLKSLTAGDE